MNDKNIKQLPFRLNLDIPQEKEVYEILEKQDNKKQYIVDAILYARDFSGMKNDILDLLHEEFSKLQIMKSTDTEQAGVTDMIEPDDLVI